MPSVNIDLEKIEMRHYRTDIKIIVGDKYYDVDETYGFNSLSAEYAYREDFFPFLHISLLLTRQQYRLLIDNKETVKFKLKLISYILDDEQKEIDSQVHIDDIFQPLLDELDNQPYDPMKEANDENILNPLKRFEYDVNLYLLKNSILESNKTIMNFIAKDCKIKDVLGYILKLAKVESALISPMQNTNIYKQILIPPLNLYNSLQYLSDVYGLYQKGMYIFYDFNYLYILRNDFRNIPLDKQDYENVYINVVSTTNSTNEMFHAGAYKDKEYKCYRVNIPNALNVSSASLSAKEDIGNRLRIFDRESIDNAVSYENGKFAFNKIYDDIEIDINGYHGKDKYQYLYNISSNKNLNSEIKKNIENIETTISFFVNNTNIEIFKPNKRFIFAFEDVSFREKYSGIYYISDMKYILDGSNGEMYLNLSFIKTEKL